jgi:hypothetical protein
MPTHCIPAALACGSVEGRAVVADFAGGAITPDAGAVLVRSARASSTEPPASA